MFDPAAPRAERADHTCGHPGWILNAIERVAGNAGCARELEP